MPTRSLQLIAVCLGLVASGCGDTRFGGSCESNADCAETELCASGVCGGIGVCRTRPETCDDTENDPVCGCDGLTYQSKCFADLVGVRLQATVPCVCKDNSECLTGQFCALEDSCTNQGSCSPIPETCEPDTQQVCGCDGVTYDNACTASQSGARVSALGACDCADNAECGADEYCNALVCDGPGVCEARQGACESGGAVTGCDGVVYESECDAAEAGQRVRPDG
jgi:hypothetical protein